MVHHAEFAEELIEALEESLDVYRLVRTLDPADPEWIRSFMSRDELGCPPRGPEVRHPIVARGVSVSRDRNRLEKDGARVRRRRPHLGGGIAQIVFEPATGIQVAEWGAPGHLTIWAPALMLADAVVDIHVIPT